MYYQVYIILIENMWIHFVGKFGKLKTCGSTFLANCTYHFPKISGFFADMWIQIFCKFGKIWKHVDPLFWQIWQNPPKHVDPLFWLTILCESTKLAKCINSQEIYNLMNSLKSEKWQKVGFTSPLFAKLMVSHQPLRFTRASRVFFPQRRFREIL